MSALPSPVRLFLRCGHPFVEENIYRGENGKARCKECQQRACRRRYEQNKLSRLWTRGRTIAPSRAFCARCVEERCVGHWWDGPDHRCFRSVTKEGDLCSCGAAFSINWLRNWLAEGERYARVAGRPERVIAEAGE